jgi:hypothetical protein
VRGILEAEESLLSERRNAARRIVCDRYSGRELAGEAVRLMTGKGTNP